MRNLMLAAAAATTLFAFPTTANAAPPRLLVLISVDGLSTGLFDEYRPLFSGGLARLASGAVFDNGSAGPSVTPQLTHAIKSRFPPSRDVVVAEDRGAALAIGSGADQRWFWEAGQFATDLAGSAPPLVVGKVNKLVAAALGRAQPPLQPPPFCAAKAKRDARQLGRAAGDAAALQASPELDGDTLALAAALADELQLGQRGAPDLLAIDLSATANVNQTYGSDGQETCLQLMELDREIGDFLSVLDGRNIVYEVEFGGAGPAGTRVPIVFWRSAFSGPTSNAQVTSADVASTLAASIGIALPGDGGRCLEGTPAACSR